MQTIFKTRWVLEPGDTVVGTLPGRAAQVVAQVVEVTPSVPPQETAQSCTIALNGENITGVWLEVGCVDEQGRAVVGNLGIVIPSMMDKNDASNHPLQVSMIRDTNACSAKPRHAVCHEWFACFCSDPEDHCGGCGFPKALHPKTGVKAEPPASNPEDDASKHP
jgi:hypothetical protein